MASLARLLLTPATIAAHRGQWYAYTGGADPATGRRERIRCTSTMRGTWPGYDVVCSCGQWESRTGGATRTSVERDFLDHRLDAQHPITATGRI